MLLKTPSLISCRWSNGRVIFASGSPFDPIVSSSGTTITPAQANNAYIFPPIGLAASLAKWPSISDDAFLLAAEALAAMTRAEDVASGRLFPPFSRIMDVSSDIVAHLLKELPPALSEIGPAVRSEEAWRHWVQGQLWTPPPAGKSKL